MIDDNLIQEFVSESIEHLSNIEPDLLLLEKDAANTSEETINSIFRAIHSIKGASGFFGFENLKHFSHQMESVFMMIRDKTLSPESDIVDVLLRGVDRLSEMVNNIDASESVDVTCESEQLAAILGGTYNNGPAQTNAEACEAAFEVACEPTTHSEFQAYAAPAETTGDNPFNLNDEYVQQAFKQGQFAYVVQLNPQQDFADSCPIDLLETLTSVGTLQAACTPAGEALCVDELPGHLQPESPHSHVYLLFTSVLEQELIPPTCNLPDDRISAAESFNLGSTAEFQEVTATTEPAPNTSAASNTFDLTTPQVAQAKAQGQFIYVLEINPQTDFTAQAAKDVMNTLTTVGQFLQAYYNGQSVEVSTAADCMLQGNPGTLYLLYATVLEMGLIPPTSGLPAQQVFNAEGFNFPADSYPTEAPVVAMAPKLSAENITSPAAAQAKPALAEKTEKPVPAINESNISSKSVVQETIRVKVDLLNRLMNLAGEMVLLRNQLNQRLTSTLQENDGLGSVLQNINLTTTELQEHIMQTRMQPIGNVFNKFNRVVRDLSGSLNKKINIEISGDEVELDKSIVESLSAPLTHLIRNSCDHGIEMPEDRLAHGKPAEGTIHLKAFQEGGQIIIAIQDDGKGIDHNMLAEKALEKGVITEAELERMSVKDKVKLIFHPGFSTAKEISDVSGRGVGMDVVRTNIEKLGGTIEVETEVGMGTILYLHLPLTLAIIPSLFVGVENYRFAIPQINLVELLRVKAEEVPHQIETVGSATILKLRGKLLPLVRLSQVLDIEQTWVNPFTGSVEEERRLSLSERRQLMEHPEVDEHHDGRPFLPRIHEDRREQPYQDTNIAVLKLGGKQYGLVVDDVHNLEEIFVKPLSAYLQNLRAFAGSTIMGDGSVAMILDVTGIAEMAALDFSQVEKEEGERKQVLDESLGNSVDMDIITFSNGNESQPNPDEEDQFAIPLQSVLRLEKFKLSHIQHVGEREFLTYQGRSLPLIRLENHLPIQSRQHNNEEAYLVIPRAGDGMAAIVANRIVDVDTVAVRLEQSHMEHPGVKGSAVIHDRITTFISPEGLMEAMGIMPKNVATLRFH